MARYIVVPLRNNADELSLDAFTTLRAFRPDWQPAEGNLDVWIIRAIAAQSAELRDIASGALDSIFRWFGPLVGIVPQDETPSVVASTWTMADNLGHTIPEGTQVGIPSPDGTIVPFRTLDDIVVPAGQTVTPAGSVSLVSIEAGADTAGIGGPGTAATLVDVLDYVSAISLTAVTVGGQDAENDDVYLDRLSTRLQALADRAILPLDFEILAADHPSVLRALALDNYNPADGTFTNERMIALALQGLDGNAVDAVTKSEVDEYLEAHREVNFIVNVIDPTFTTVDVRTSFTVVTGYPPEEAKANAEAAISRYLDPKLWGSDLSGDATVWDRKTVVRIYELVTVINNAAGVDYITVIEQRTGANAYASTDITLTGAAPLPRPGAIVGTVV